MAAIDGFVLGTLLPRWLSPDSGYKSVSSKDRLEQFSTLIVNKTHLFGLIKFACRIHYCKQSAQGIANMFYEAMVESTGK